METNKSQYQKEEKNPQITLSQSFIYNVKAHSGKITQKPVANHLNLRLSTFLCFASQTAAAAARGVKKHRLLSQTVALCEQCVEDCTIAAEAPVEHEGSIQAKICAAFWPDLLRLPVGCAVD